MIAGALLVDKPSGPTSHDVVAFARRLLRTSRIGHTGTLDPLATGLLVLLVGPATRVAQFLAADEKEYIADVRLGVATPTYDAQSLSEVRGPTSEVRGPRAEGRDPTSEGRDPTSEGRGPTSEGRGPTSEGRGPRSDVRLPTEAELGAALDRFRGSFLQTPPPYSAKKVAGVAAYEKARRNEPIELKPVPVTVHALDVLPHDADVEPALLRLRVAVSAGFYVRSLAHDLGQALGCGAHLEALRRTRAGRFRVEDAATLDTLQAAGPAAADRVIPVSALLGHLPAVTLTAEGLRRAANGNPLAPGHLENGDSPRFPAAETGTVPVFRVLDAAGTVLAIAERRPDGLLHPVVVLR